MTKLSRVDLDTEDHGQLKTRRGSWSGTVEVLNYVHWYEVDKRTEED